MIVPGCVLELKPKKRCIKIRFAFLAEPTYAYYHLLVSAMHNLKLLGIVHTHMHTVCTYMHT